MKPLILAVGISACLPSAFAKEAATRLPTLAVAVSRHAGRTEPREPGTPAGDRAGNQRFLQLVDRKNIQAILKEHAIASAT